MIHGLQPPDNFEINNFADGSMVLMLNINGIKVQAGTPARGENALRYCTQDRQSYDFSDPVKEIESLEGKYWAEDIIRELKKYYGVK
jgi:hypothetical protein